MTAFRWVVGVLSGLLAAWALLGFVIGIAFDNAVWHARARAARHALFVTALLWFNIEVWGRVVVTLIRWR